MKRDDPCKYASSERRYTWGLDVAEAYAQGRDDAPSYALPSTDTPGFACAYASHVRDTADPKLITLPVKEAYEHWQDSGGLTLEKTREYTVTWSVKVHATHPEQAAVMADDIAATRGIEEFVYLVKEDEYGTTRPVVIATKQDS